MLTCEFTCKEIRLRPTPIKKQGGDLTLSLKEKEKTSLFITKSISRKVQQKRMIIVIKKINN